MILCDEKWKFQAQTAKESLTADLPNEMLQELIDESKNSSSDLRCIYEELRQHIIMRGRLGLNN